MSIDRQNRLPEIISQGHIENLKQDWNALTKDMQARVQAHKEGRGVLSEREREVLDKIRQIERLKAQSTAHINFAMMQFNTGREPEKIQESFALAMDLYNEAVSIRIEVLMQNANPEVSGPIDQMINELQKDNSKDPRITVLESLKKKVKGLEDGKNPYVMTSKSRGKDQYSVNFEKIQEVKDLLKELQSLKGLFGRQLGEIENKINQSFGVMESADRQGAAYAKLNQNMKEMMPNMGYKPLRILGALGAITIGTLGLASFLYQKIIKRNDNAQFSPLIAGWFGAAYLLANPGAMGGPEAQALAALKDFPPEDMELVRKGFQGDKGNEAIAKLKSLAKTKNMKELMKKEVSIGGLEQITESKEGPLIDAMKKYGSNKERAEALGVIMSMINDGRSKNLLQNFVQNAAKLPPMPVV